MHATIKIKGYSGIERLELGRRTAVFKARSKKHKGPVVIKVLLPHLAGSRRFVSRFTRVARAALDIRHPNLVDTLDLGKADETYFVVVEHYDGVALDDILAEHPRVPNDTALGIVLSLCHALQEVHAHGLVHRDVRPANVVLTSDGTVRLSNLGFATDLGERGRVTHAGKVTATPAYMSPEQTSGETLSPQSDIFSLGAVAFELLTGRRAFGSGDFGDIVEKIQSSVAPAASALNPLVEPAFDRILATMLEKDVERRYPHVSELIMDLEEAMEKYAHTVDDDSLAAYAADPGMHVDLHNEQLLVRLAARAPVRDKGKPGNAETLARYYRKLVYLDPSDEGAKRELKRLERDATGAKGRMAPLPVERSRHAHLDPNAEYRVVLESFDPQRENEASFALKLSMKLRTPLPRIKSLVKNAPSGVAGPLGYKGALALARAIEEVGGVVRLDICRPDAPAGEPDARWKKTPDAKSGGRVCSSCGWADVEAAEYCSMCYEPFEDSRPPHPPAMESQTPTHNPLAEEPSTGAKGPKGPWKRWLHPKRKS